MNERAVARLLLLFLAAIVCSAVVSKTIADASDDSGEQKEEDAPEKAEKNGRPDQGSEFLREIRRASAPILLEMGKEHGYALGSGQHIRRVAPPFPPIRMDYYRTAHPTQAEAIPAGPSAIIFRANNEGLHDWGMTFGKADHGYDLNTLLDALLGLKSQQIEGPAELLRQRFSGDWVIRERVVDFKSVAARQLETILQKELSQPIHLEFRTVERLVYVAGGEYRFAPLPGREGKGRLVLTDETRETDRIDIYGKELAPNSGAGGGSGEFETFLDWLGRWISTPIVSEVKEPPADWLTWYLHEREPSTAATRAEDHDPKTVLANITAQTGLTFAQEKRQVKILFVERTK
jgi:hypothetical protein